MNTPKDMHLEDTIDFGDGPRIIDAIHTHGHRTNLIATHHDTGSIVTFTLRDDVHITKSPNTGHWNLVNADQLTKVQFYTGTPDFYVEMDDQHILTVPVDVERDGRLTCIGLFLNDEDPLYAAETISMDGQHFIDGNVKNFGVDTYIEKALSDDLGGSTVTITGTLDQMVRFLSWYDGEHLTEQQVRDQITQKLATVAK